MIPYFRPDNLEDALSVLSEHSLTLLAGGTDFFPARVGKSITDNVLDLSGIEQLRKIQQTADGLLLGALTTWTDIVEAQLPTAFDGLKQAAKTIGGVQTQNAGTLCGNICNASPAADSVPNLLALEAEVKLQSVRETRILPLEKFILGNRKTAKKEDELISGIFIPRPAKKARGNFEKLGTRAYLVISIVMVGVVAELNERDEVLNLIEIRPVHFESLEPIDDIRATADYRKKVVPELLLRAIKGVI
jgi:CO/xanthine dehydrogenase FAD-binding subunit